MAAPHGCRFLGRWHVLLCLLGWGGTAHPPLTHPTLVSQTGGRGRSRKAKSDILVFKFRKVRPGDSLCAGWLAGEHWA